MCDLKALLLHMSPLWSCSFCVEIVPTFAARLRTSYEGFSFTYFVYAVKYFHFIVILQYCNIRYLIAHAHKKGGVEAATQGVHLGTLADQESARTHARARSKGGLVEGELSIHVASRQFQEKLA